MNVKGMSSVDEKKESIVSFYISIIITAVFASVCLILSGCGGGSASSYSEKTGLLTMDVSKGFISVDMSDQTGSMSDENVDVSFQYSSYNDNLKALPVVIRSYEIDYSREDCQGCPAPPSRTVASGLTIKAGESKTQNITVLSRADKLSLPVSAMRKDLYNPVLNQNPIVAETHSQELAVGVSATAGTIGTGEQFTYDFGTYSSGYSFTGKLTAPVLKNSVRLLINDSTVGGDNGDGTITGTRTDTVTNEKIATGDGATTTFTFGLAGGIYPTGLIITAGSVTGVDNGAGTITGSGISGTINYSTGLGSVTFTSPPASGVSITASYTYMNTFSGTVNYSTGSINITSNSYLKKGDRVRVQYTVDRTTGSISGNTVTFPAVILPGNSSSVIVKGTVIVLLDGSIIGRDNGSGSITGSAGGTVDYQNRTVNVSITPVPSQGVVTVTAAVSPLTVNLTPVPVVKNSLSLKWGDITCTETGGTLQYPCSGSVDYTSGVISDLRIDSTAVSSGNASSIVASFSVNSFNTQGGEKLVYGTGGSEYTLNLRYIPIAPPSESYALTIMTTGGLLIKDAGSGVLKGDVCQSKASSVNYSTGVAVVCFSRPVASDEAIFAYYRTGSIRLKARIRAIGDEVGGDRIELQKDISLILN